MEDELLPSTTYEIPEFCELPIIDPNAKSGKRLMVIIIEKCQCCPKCIRISKSSSRCRCYDKFIDDDTIIQDWCPLPEVKE